MIAGTAWNCVARRFFLKKIISFLTSSRAGAILTKPLRERFHNVEFSVVRSFSICPVIARALSILVGKSLLTRALYNSELRSSMDFHLVISIEDGRFLRARHMYNLEEIDRYGVDR